MGPGEGGPAERAFDAFVELLGAGGFGGVGELLGMEGKVPAALEREGAPEAGGFFLEYDDSAAYPPPLIASSYTPPCFAGGEGSFQNNDGDKKKNGFSHKSGESCSATTPSSSSSNSGGRPSNPKPKKKTEQRREDPSPAAARGRTAAAEGTTTTSAKAATPRAAAATKKPRKEQPEQGQQRPPSSQRRTTSKVMRKEKLGERINALQHLVSPFGKTDTASVLHEALGYIKFLHDQVQVLSSPYLQRLPCSATPTHGAAEARRDLRSRGLCLVPVACTAQVAASNGADLWSPAAMGSCGGVDVDRRRRHQPACLSKH